MSIGTIYYIKYLVSGSTDIELGSSKKLALHWEKYGLLTGEEEFYLQFCREGRQINGVLKTICLSLTKEELSFENYRCIHLEVCDNPTRLISILQRPKVKGAKKEIKEKKVEIALEESKCRWRGKNFFLTYSKCSLSLEKLEEHFKNSYFNSPSYLISEELHEDGSPHFHVLLLFGKQKDVKNVFYFDLLDFHPNIKMIPEKEVAATIKYVTKEGTFVTNMELTVDNRIPTKTDLLVSFYKRNGGTPALDYLEEISTPEEWVNDFSKFQTFLKNKCSLGFPY